MSKKIPRIAVIGGGISGLTCAYRLAELSQDKQFPIELTLLEASSRLGGTISTIQEEGCLLELGPDAIFTEKPAALQFGKKLGLENRWIGTNPQCRKSFVAYENKLYPVPEGFYLMAPSKLLPMLLSPLFSWKGKLRMLLEPFLPSKKNSGDESLASFVRRRLGAEVLERMAQPMIGGIYSTDPDSLSLEATFPKFLEWERIYGSVTKGLIRQLSSHQSRGPRYSLFVSLKEGLEQFIKEIQKKLPNDTVRLGVEVKEIQPISPSGKKFKLVYKNGTTEEFDGVSIATPSPIASKILNRLDPEISQELSKIEYASCLTVNLIYKTEDFKNPIEGFGFVVPVTENKLLTGCTFSSIKFSDRAPQDKTILRVFIGGKQYSQISSLDNNAIVERVKKELKEILSLNSNPIRALLFHHKEALPQYKVGHRKIAEAVNEKIKHWAGLVLCGNGYSGTGIPDCIESGEKSAEVLFTQIIKPEYIL